jgi:hypothetical protein
MALQKSAVSYNVALEPQGTQANSNSVQAAPAKLSRIAQLEQRVRQLEASIELHAKEVFERFAELTDHLGL